MSGDERSVEKLRRAFASMLVLAGLFVFVQEGRSLIDAPSAQGVAASAARESDR